VADISRDPANGVIRLVINGSPLSIPQFQALLDDLTTASWWNAGLPVLEDVRQMETEPSIACARAMIDYFHAVPARVTGSRWALLVPRDNPAMYGIGRMTETIAEGGPVEVRVFTDEGQALDWLVRHGE
jgi:hypothetical protein